VSRRPLLFESSPRLIYGHDLIVAGAAMTAALIGRFAFEDKAIPGMLLPAAVLTYALVCAVVFPAFGLHRGSGATRRCATSGACFWR
jgi:hypothetical protein